jgi:hypothetical protein
MSSRKIQSAIQLYSAALVFFLAIGSDTAWAQGTIPAPLPPAAQEALDKGIIAAKVPDYLLAIRLFDDARKLAPQAPIIYLNLGLAESRIPGRELRAIAWFGAYLTALPAAPNAAAVKEQIAALDVRNQSNVSRLLQSAQDAANQMLGNQKTLSLGDVATLWAKAGDSKAALKIAERLETVYKDAAERDVSEAQAKGGDLAGAKETADLIQMADFKSDAQIRIAGAQIEAGDGMGAQNTLAFAQQSADHIEDRAQKSSTQKHIAEIQIKAGDGMGARSTLTSARSASQLALKVSDWLTKLDDGSNSYCPLNTEPFLDLAGYLKSLPPSSNPRDVFKSLQETANTIVNAQIVIHQMLKRQAKR